mgnify:CR=1 FL=1
MNYFAVLLSAIAMMAIGFFWYGALFGKLWMEGMGINPDDAARKKEMQKAAGPAYLQMFVGALFTSFVFSYFFGTWSSGTAFDQAISGMFYGFLAWLGFALPVIYGRKLWEGKSFKYVAIDLGYYLVSLLVVGVIVASCTKMDLDRGFMGIEDTAQMDYSILPDGTYINEKYGFEFTPTSDWLIGYDTTNTIFTFMTALGEEGEVLLSPRGMADFSFEEDPENGRRIVVIAGQKWQVDTFYHCGDGSSQVGCTASFSYTNQELEDNAAQNSDKGFNWEFHIFTSKINPKTDPYEDYPYEVEEIENSLATFKLY